jgi:hypothetical protein
MKLERSDWLVADKELAEAADSWWVMAAMGLALEAVLWLGLYEGSKLINPYGPICSCLLGARVICGCIGAWGWANGNLEPTFWSFQSKWAMQFFPGSLLSWHRQRRARRFVQKLVEDIDGRIELATEQTAYYTKGAAKAELGITRLEMACWASALRECKGRWESQRQQEKMKSAVARSRALEDLGLGKIEVGKSLLSLERLEISGVAREPIDVAPRNALRL